MLELGRHNGLKAVLDPAVVYLAAGDDHSAFQGLVGQYGQDGIVFFGNGHSPVHVLPFGGQRHDPGAAELVALAHRGVAADAGHGVIRYGIEGRQSLVVDAEQAVMGRRKADLALAGSGAEDLVSAEHFADSQSRVLFVDLVGLRIPHENVVLADIQHPGHVLFGDHVAPLEQHALEAVFEDGRNVVTEDLSHCVLGFHLFHDSTFLFL